MREGPRMQNLRWVLAVCETANAATDAGEAGSNGTVSTSVHVLSRDELAM